MANLNPDHFGDMLHCLDCKEDVININDSCQVEADTMLGPEASPFNAISDDQVWSPAVRTGDKWANYLVFDFKMPMRISKVRVGTPETLNGRNYRIAERVRVESSNVPDKQYLLVEKALPGDKMIVFDKPIIARYIRLTIIPSYVNADSMAIGVNK